MKRNEPKLTEIKFNDPKKVRRSTKIRRSKRIRRWESPQIATVWKFRQWKNCDSPKKSTLIFCAISTPYYKGHSLSSVKVSKCNFLLQLRIELHGSIVICNDAAIIPIFDVLVSHWCSFRSLSKLYTRNMRQFPPDWQNLTDFASLVVVIRTISKE